jgi:hypothetical protein
MHSITRKVATTTVAVVGALSITGGSAFAFECYNASRSDRGNEAAAKSPALISAEEALAMFCGVEGERAAEALATLEAQGFDTSFLINGNALMAGGLEKNGKGAEKLHDGKAIDHLSEEFFGALFTVLPECAGGE